MHLTHKASLVQAFLAVGGFAALPASAQNLVTNPGFEMGDFTGYTVSGPVSLSRVSDTGQYAAQFSGNNTLGHLSQNIATIAGNTYNISFFLRNLGSGPNDFRSSFAGFQGPGAFNAAPFSYTQFSFTAVATSTTSVLQFDGSENPGGFLLDDISVTAAAPVPEASSIVSLGLLLLLGLGGVAVSRRHNAGAAR